MNGAAYLLPAVAAVILLVASVRRVRVYDSFAAGAAGALPLLKNLFPYIAAVLVLAELFEKSGLSSALCSALAPAFSFFGIPEEIAPLVLVKPFSGSGSLSLVSELFQTYGADSFAARCAATVYASGETVFYLSAVYFSSSGKKPVAPVLIALAGNFLASVLGCALCRVL